MSGKGTIINTGVLAKHSKPWSPFPEIAMRHAFRQSSLHCLVQLVATPVGAPADKAVAFLANSWVASSDPQTVLEDSAGRDSEGRVFFTGTPYLPKDTPAGLEKYRENELATLRVRASPLATSEPTLPTREWVPHIPGSTLAGFFCLKTPLQGSRSTWSTNLPRSGAEQPTRALSSGWSAAAPHLLQVGCVNNVIGYIVGSDHDVSVACRVRGSPRHSARAHSASTSMMCKRALSLQPITAVTAGYHSCVRSKQTAEAPSCRVMLYFMLPRCLQHITSVHGSSTDCTCSYNDLGGKDEAKDITVQRPVLGINAARGGTLPYPRRLYTGRQTVKIEDGPFKGQVMEVNPSGVPWLPYDEVRIPSALLMHA